MIDLFGNYYRNETTLDNNHLLMKVIWAILGLKDHIYYHVLLWMDSCDFRLFGKKLCIDEWRIMAITQTVRLSAICLCKMPGHDLGQSMVGMDQKWMMTVPQMESVADLAAGLIMTQVAYTRLVSFTETTNDTSHVGDNGKTNLWLVYHSRWYIDKRQCASIHNTGTSDKIIRELFIFQTSKVTTVTSMKFAWFIQGWSMNL